MDCLIKAFTSDGDKSRQLCVQVKSRWWTCVHYLACLTLYELASNLHYCLPKPKVQWNGIITDGRKSERPLLLQFHQYSACLLHAWLSFMTPLLGKIPSRSRVTRWYLLCISLLPGKPSEYVEDEKSSRKSSPFSLLVLLIATCMVFGIRNWNLQLQKKSNSLIQVTPNM